MGIVLIVILSIGAIVSFLSMIVCYKDKNRPAYLGWFSATCFALSGICGIVGG